MEAEASYAAEPNDNSSPGLLYDRRWATMLLANVDAELKQRYQSRGNAELFDVIYDFLDEIPPESSQTKAAQTLEMTVAAVKMAIKRMRDRRTRILRSHVSATVASPDLIDEEIAHVIGLCYPEREIRKP